MPLSEQERRALEELETQLSVEDPRFASAMVADPYRAQRRRRVALAALAVVLGLGVILLAVVLHQTWLAGVGFVAMVLGVAQALSPQKSQLHAVVGSSSPRRTGSVRRTRKDTRLAAPRAQRGDFMNRLEERWERRRRETQGW